jgi:pSer/pThr/pTyr-binding forkhead associated (FHA) protein
MNRLVVKPNSPDTWEIQLKNGENRLGRGEANDFKVGDPSVSGSHCQIIVNDGTVSIQDLGSTNGTFINGGRVQEAMLQNGQNIRLGSVEMVFYADSPQYAATPAGSRLRVSGIHHEPPEAAPATTDAPPPLIASAPALQPAASFCKFHPKSPARWFCNRCSKSFCDLCVTSRNAEERVLKLCRSCGVECAPLQVNFAAPVERGFMGSLPGAFIYPFRGTGILVLIFGSLVFAGLSIISAGIIAILPKIIALGYLFSYMQNIIHATAAEETEMPEMPGFDDVFGGFLRLAGTVVMSFGIPIGLLVAKFFDVEIPVEAIIATSILGCVYFPMAFLAVAMKDNVMAANPLVVVPSILRVPLPYIVTVILFTSIFGVQEIGNIVSYGAKSVSFTTTSMKVMFIAFGIQIFWSFAKVYLLTVSMRIMGLLYATQKEKLGWY